MSLGNRRDTFQDVVYLYNNFWGKIFQFFCGDVVWPGGFGVWKVLYNISDILWEDEYLALGGSVRKFCVV